MNIYSEDGDIGAFELRPWDVQRINASEEVVGDAAVPVYTGSFKKYFTTFEIHINLFKVVCVKKK